MAFHVMDADGRDAQGPRQAASDSRPNQQRADQSRTSRVSDAVDLPLGDVGVCNHLPDQRHQFLDMVAGCQFGYYASVFRMGSYLAVQTMSQEPLLSVIDRYACFIAGRFNAEYMHTNWLLPRAL